MESQEQQNDVQQNQEPVSVETEQNNDLAYFNEGVATPNYGSNQTTIASTQNGQPSLLKAIMLSAAFGLIGCVVFGVLYYFGFIAFIGAYLIFSLACYGYKKFNNNVIDKKGYAIVVAISIVELFIAILIALSVVIMREISGVGLMNALSFIPDLMELSPDFKSALISDIVISIIFVFVGLLFDIIQAKKRAKMNGTV